MGAEFCFNGGEGCKGTVVKWQGFTGHNQKITNILYQQHYGAGISIGLITPAVL
jgi:hypothetical protein